MMKKKLNKRNLMHPKLSDLNIGSIRPIYIDYQHEDNLRGYAMILERIPISDIVSNYIIAEIGGGEQRGGHNVVWKHDKFKVAFVDPWDYDINMPIEERNKYIGLKGFTTISKIAYFHHIGIQAEPKTKHKPRKQKITSVIDIKNNMGKTEGIR